jgi:hypothetical protein
MDSKENNLIGKTAVVTLDIDPGDEGKVALNRNGMRASMFARSNVTDLIKRGTKVLITDVLDTNTLNVQPL